MLRDCLDQMTKGEKGAKRVEIEPDRSDLEKGFSAFRQALRVASEAPEADQPAKGALNVPPLRLKLKTTTFPFGSWHQLTIDENRFPFPFLGRLVLWLEKDLCLPAQARFDPIEQRSGLSLISEQQADARKTSDEIVQKQDGCVSLTKSGSKHENGEQKALGLHQKHPFAAPDVVSRRRSRVHRLARDRL